ncbi:MAG: CTP synthase, partial [Firmicutes bacterium]|nr:CTP synthase [Candidatus Alectryobacillus merdavium]
MDTKFIFVTGGVVSSLGKGISASSLGLLLKKHGLKVFMQKFDPYLNIDPGTMSPYQHGEVFVTEDGTETDLDLGHYERFIDENLTRESSVTSGRIYKHVLDKERKGDYLGSTIQVIPHITDEIKRRIKLAETKSNADVIITEIGGTVGDIESLPFIEAIRQFRIERGYDNVLFIHNTLVPYLKSSEELKTKPTQHSVKELQSYGIQPDVIILRSEKKVNDAQKSKISMFCNIAKEAVFEALDQRIIYEIITSLYNQGFDKYVLKRMNFEEKYQKDISLDDFKELIKNIKNLKKELNIAIVGKYVELHDAYISITESLKHSGYKYDSKINISWINSENINEDNVKENLDVCDGVVIPGGFGVRGTEGKLAAIKYCRENDKPLLGICFGFQLALIEYAKNVLHIEGANSTELDENCKNNIIDYLPQQYKGIDLGGTMRLGAYDCVLNKESLSYSLYEKDQISERHRHRYEFNNKYLDLFKNDPNFIVAGVNPQTNLLEI